MEGPSRAALAAARATLDQVTAVPVGGRTAASPDPGQIAADLRAVADLLGADLTLRRALADPSVPAGAREGLADRLFGSRLGQASLAVVRSAVAGRWSRPLDLRLGLIELAVEALLVDAEVAGALDEVEDELFRLGRILDRNPQLSLALTDSAAPTSAKEALLERLLAGKAHPVTVRLAKQAVADREFGDLGRRIEQFSRIAAARRDRVVAVVRTAVPLDADQVARLRAALSRYFGREIQVQTDLDPSVLGGVVVRVGDEVVDGSVLRRLAAARQALTR
ncbi:F0F1 ATP synthase subunit delta [Frankia sp. CNm7]|uniref:ATP synthase subunit delta n=1 Tax=Frankia nepalensis TaxID=1836974 RepID=A0A937RHQ0_9ACTN|nr:F0F1 ATP synthase subunit delta [Frankia nepalensis]MBL7499715.1 F0F1 ATP synthase subunit delta [Frankia nepalensis]MBL7510897.1 F0F1 ATP synthase subunit delta [Frankia nepalensis]MBL7521387.1 F0F1 ATP synthase subunit delta [Frankia nepalensis]MBL7630397.1 F0F1 ATP synthase subunit delta [Frankia nepalensis]